MKKVLTWSGVIGVLIAIPFVLLGLKIVASIVEAALWGVGAAVVIGLVAFFVGRTTKS